MDRMTAVATFDYENFFDVVMIDKPVNARLPASGYGKKLPTNWVINYEGRMRRVYADVFGNAGHSYIMVKGRKLTIM